MTPRDERRTSARLLTEFPLVVLDETGRALDDRALAHDVSDKGFRAETQADLARGAFFRFRLALDDGEICGRARVVWIEKTELSRWVGAEFQSMSWGDRRRLRRLTSPGGADWNLIADKMLIAILWIVPLVLIWRGLASPTWRTVFGELFPKAVAAVIAGLALREFLRSDR